MAVENTGRQTVTEPFPSRAAIGILALACLLVSGCAGGESTAGSSSNHGASTPVSSGAAAHATASTGQPTDVPAPVSDFPEGVYRTELTVERLHNLGLDDPYNAGVWTLTIRSGRYELDCRPIADPGVDCGGSDPGDTLGEVGIVRGSAPTIWFVHDMALKSRLTGCSVANKGCGPDGGYHLDWRVVPHGVAFSNFVGLGDEAIEPAFSTWTVQPWTKLS